MKRWLLILVVYASLFIVYIYFFGTKVQPADWMQIMLMTALVGVTIFYAWATHRQATASAKTVERMKEQTLIASRPLIIHKAVSNSDVLMQSSSDRKPWLRSEYFSHFLVKNVGNGPAIELEIALLDKNKNLLEAHRETYLRPGEEIDFGDLATAYLEESTYYVVCEYRIVFPLETDKTWEQTWLPFKLSKASKEGEVYVAPGELEFRTVAMKDRISAFGSDKPA